MRFEYIIIPRKRIFILEDTNYMQVELSIRSEALGFSRTGEDIDFSKHRTPGYPLLLKVLNP